MADPQLESIIQKMIDAGEPEDAIASVIKEYKPAATEKPYSGPPVDGGPEDYWSGFLTSLKPGGSSDQAALKGAKGFAKEIVPGAVKAVLHLPGQVVDLVKELVATGVGGVNLVKDPVATLTAAAEKLGNVPGQVKDAYNAALKLAAQDPEAFGKGVADVTAEAGLGVALSKAVPMAPKPIARQVGSVMEQVGTKGAWPIRMMGAHQLGSGNPMGVLTMMAPETLKAGGEKLSKYGGSIRLAPDQTQFVKTVESQLSKSLDKIPSKAAAGLEDIDAAINAEKKNASGIRIASAKRETALKDLEARADLEHQGNRVRHDATVDSKQTELLENFQKTQAEAKANKVIDTAIAKDDLKPSAPKITETIKAPGRTMQTTFAAEGSGLTPMEQELLKRASSVKAVPSHRSIDSIAPKTEPIKPIRPVSSHTAGETPAVDPSRSRRPQSEIKGMSVEDVSAMQDILEKNPGISPEDAAAEVVKQRAQRSNMYRNDARLNKLEQSALDREID